MSFRFCKQCRREWADRAAFLADPGLVLSGCQMDTERPAGSALLFDHKVAGCGTTIAVPVGAFEDLCRGPAHKVNWAPSAKCLKMCFDPRNLEPCPAPCSCACVREILQAVRRTPKSAAGR